MFSKFSIIRTFIPTWEPHSLIRSTQLHSVYLDLLSSRSKHVWFWPWHFTDRWGIWHTSEGILPQSELHSQIPCLPGACQCQRPTGSGLAEAGLRHSCQEPSKVCVYVRVKLQAGRIHFIEIYVSLVECLIWQNFKFPHKILVSPRVVESEIWKNLKSVRT